MDAATELRRAIRGYLESPPRGGPDLRDPLQALDAALARTTSAQDPPRSLVGRDYPNTGSRLASAASSYRKVASDQVTITGPIDAILKAFQSPGMRQAQEITEPPNHAGQVPEPDAEWAGHDPQPVVRQ